ncbi:MAG TPA: polysaccharide pyruvyl transferase family protein [Candidatus Peribacterales bacterium]|nr:polysaccharide pyruvyl transferase family protein [Candidatus Peribacterales bacterium]
MRYLLVGNYGVRNAGDEALREYFLRRYPEVSWQVLSARPREGELPRFPAGIRSLLSLMWLRTVFALSRSNGIVFGGGSLFTDGESLQACIVWIVPVLFARLLRKPYFLAFQGLGPFRTSLGEKISRYAFAHASYVSLRDTASAERSVLWKKNTEVVQSFDPTISLMKNKNPTFRSKNLFVFIPRFSTEWNPKILRKFVEGFERLRKEGFEIRILSMQSHHSGERRLTEKLSHLLSTPVRETVTMDEVLEEFKDATCIITQRYHAIVAAAIVSGIPFLALRQFKGDKLDALAGMCHCPSETLESFDPATLLDTDWEALHERLVSLLGQYGMLVEQGEVTLRAALKSFAAR